MHEEIEQAVSKLVEQDEPDFDLTEPEHDPLLMASQLSVEEMIAELDNILEDVLANRMQVADTILPHAVIEYVKRLLISNAQED